MNDNPNLDNGFSFFGKLPQFPDFIKHRAVSDEFSILDDWLQKGIISSKLIYGNNWKEIYESSQSFEFILPVESSDKIICGVVNPGIDKSGRHFPFIVFMFFRREFFNSFRIGALPLVLNSFFYKAKQLFLFSLKSPGLTEIVNEFNKAGIRISSVSAADNIFSEYLLSTTLIELINRFQLKSLNADYKTASNSDIFSFSFCSNDENINFDTGFILEMIKNKMKSEQNIPCIFKINDENFKVRLHVYSTLPEPNEFPKLISGEVSNLNLKDFISVENYYVTLENFLTNHQTTIN